MRGTQHRQERTRFGDWLLGSIGELLGRQDRVVDGVEPARAAFISPVPTLLARTTTYLTVPRGLPSRTTSPKMFSCCPSSARLFMSKLTVPRSESGRWSFQSLTLRVRTSLMFCSFRGISTNSYQCTQGSTYVEEEELGLVPVRRAGVVLGVRARKFGASGDGERDVRVGSTSTDLGALEVASVVDGDGENSARRVDRSSGKHLLEVCRRREGQRGFKMRKRGDGNALRVKVLGAYITARS